MNSDVKSPGSPPAGSAGAEAAGGGATGGGDGGGTAVGGPDWAPKIEVNSPAGGAAAAGADRGAGGGAGRGGISPGTTTGSVNGAAMPLTGLDVTGGAGLAGIRGEITTVASLAGGAGADFAVGAIGGSGGGGVSPGRNEGGSAALGPSSAVIQASRLTKLCSILVTMIGTPATSSRSTIRCFFSSGRNSTRASRSRLGSSSAPSKWCSITIALVAVRMASTERTGPLESCLRGP